MKPGFSYHLPNYTHPDTRREQLCGRGVEPEQIAAVGSVLELLDE